MPPASPSRGFHAPTQFRFGRDVLDELPGVIRRFGRRVLLVTGRDSMRRSGVVERIQSQLSAGGFETVWFEGVSPNPRTHEVDQAAQLGRGKGVDAVVGLGGGSAIDAAKGVAAVLETGKPSARLLAAGEPIELARPVIAIPTTAGTGSELSKGAILTNTEAGIKTGLRGGALFPAVALVDPQLTLTLPDALRRATGFDVLCHAVETFLSLRAQPATDAIAMMAVATVRDVLIWPHPSGDDDPVDRWGELSYVSSMMGINLANSSTCLPHRMQYAFGALTDSTHPEGLAAIYPEWFAVVAQAVPGRVKALLEVLFAKHPMRLEWIARPAEAMREVLRVLGLARSLADLGVDTEEKLEWCIDHVRGTLDVDPAWQGPETVRSIFLSAYRRD